MIGFQSEQRPWPAKRVTPNEHADVRALILAAFKQARAKGKPDWEVMTTAVLKNRILQLTGLSFNPNDYGASTLPTTALPV